MFLLSLHATSNKILYIDPFLESQNLQKQNFVCVVTSNFASVVANRAIDLKSFYASAFAGIIAQLFLAVVDLVKSAVFGE